MITTVCRKSTFNAAHRLFNPDWSEEENLRVYGKCSYPNYHGHNYTLIVKVTGEVDEESGYLMDMGKLADLVQEEIIETFDHKNLNLDTVAFKNKITSTENFAAVIWNMLRKKIDSKFSLTIVLYETERNFVEYRGE